MLKKFGANSPKKSHLDDVFLSQLGNLHLCLPNAKINKEYVYSFHFHQLGLANIDKFRFEGFEAIGLAYHLDTAELLGIPTQAGDHKITLVCERKDENGNLKEFRKEFNFVVNPDIRSLWKDIPTEPSILYFKPDATSATVLTPSSTMLAASIRGRSHGHEGIPRDDDFELMYQELGWHIITVADGAGSAQFSREGARIACQTAKRATSKYLKTYADTLEQCIAAYVGCKNSEHAKELGDTLYRILAAAAFQARKDIIIEANLQNISIKNYATTLLLTVTKKFDFGWFIAAFWVGDGGIAIYDASTSYLKVLGEPDGGEFAGQTRFLTMDEIFKPEELYRRLRFDIVDNFTALILLTDGVTDPKFETDAGLNRIEMWDKLWNEITTSVDLNNPDTRETQLLDWLNFWSPGNHDDRTIAFLYNH